MHTSNIRLMLLAGVIAAGASSDALADLTSSYQFNGKGNWSIDGLGGNGLGDNTPVGFLQASVPVGATIEKAFLYSSLFSLGGSISAPSVTFEGTTYSGAAWTSLGQYQPQAGPNPNFWLGAFRADVTAQVTTLAGGGSASLFSWAVNGETPTGNVDGEVLAIVYSLPTESTRTIAFLDGFSTSSGDVTTINFASPLTAGQLADPGFEANLSLGIGFSTGGSQSSTVDIDIAGNRLTSAAGGADDGSIANGALITAGGIGDDPANPLDPNSTASADDELYTLDPFLSDGMSSFDILTRNPSLDDNIFFAGLNVTAVAGVNVDPPPPGVPDAGSTALLLGLALPGLWACRRMRRE